MDRPPLTHAPIVSKYSKQQPTYGSPSSAKILELLSQEPDLTEAEIARRLGVRQAWVSQVVRQSRSDFGAVAMATMIHEHVQLKLMMRDLLAEVRELTGKPVDIITARLQEIEQRGLAGNAGQSPASSGRVPPDS